MVRDERKKIKIGHVGTYCLNMMTSEEKKFLIILGELGPFFFQEKIK
jgi:hypothetical protein